MRSECHILGFSYVFVPILSLNLVFWFILEAKIRRLELSLVAELVEFRRESKVRIVE